MRPVIANHSSPRWTVLTAPGLMPRRRNSALALMHTLVDRKIPLPIFSPDRYSRTKGRMPSFWEGGFNGTHQHVPELIGNRRTLPVQSGRSEWLLTGDRYYLTIGGVDWGRGSIAWHLAVHWRALGKVSIGGRRVRDRARMPL